VAKIAGLGAAESKGNVHGVALDTVVEKAGLITREAVTAHLAYLVWAMSAWMHRQAQVLWISQYSEEENHDK
jgi:hypothetical protein